jgi:hypothetical protein
MLLDDLNQCIYYGYGQVITYDHLDELYELSSCFPIFKDMPIQIFLYDAMIEEISMMKFTSKETVGGDK